MGSIFSEHKFLSSCGKKLILCEISGEELTNKKQKQKANKTNEQND
jgi:hypothetical protein